MIGNASLLEMIWTGLALIALSLWIGGVLTALADARALQMRPAHRGNGPRAEILRARLWTALLDALVQAGFVGIGVIAMWTPPPVRPPIEASAAATGLLLVAIEFILCLKAVVMWVGRIRANRALDRPWRQKRGTNDPTNGS